MMLYRPDIIDSDDYNLIYSLIAGRSSGTVAALVATALTQYPVRLPKSRADWFNLILANYKRDREPAQAAAILAVAFQGASVPMSTGIIFRHICCLAHVVCDDPATIPDLTEEFQRYSSLDIQAMLDSGMVAPDAAFTFCASPDKDIRDCALWLISDRYPEYLDAAQDIAQNCKPAGRRMRAR